MISISVNSTTLNGTVILPASKSISNRLLILQSRYGNRLKIENLSDSDDTLLLASTLDIVNRYMLTEENGLLRIDARNAGTVLRFLVPLLSITPGHFLLTGIERMKNRPVGALVDAMRELGASIEYAENTGFPPLLIKGRRIYGHRISVDSSVSSQFVTALLLLAPTLPDGLTIDLKGTSVSSPYVRMTTGILGKLGIEVISQQDSIRVFPKPELNASFKVEADWSAASFWYCLMSMAESGRVVLPGLKKSNMQGDQSLIDIFRYLGVRTLEENDEIIIERYGTPAEFFAADFTDTPDLALPVIMACAVAGTDGRFTGLESLRLKESDRIEALGAGLAKAGVILFEEYPGAWRIKGRMAARGQLTPEDFSDHRVAMTFACLAMKGYRVHLNNPSVVNKSYPGFWKDLQSVGFTCKVSN